MPTLHLVTDADIELHQARRDLAELRAAYDRVPGRDRGPAGKQAAEQAAMVADLETRQSS